MLDGIFTAAIQAAVQYRVFASLANDADDHVRRVHVVYRVLDVVRVPGLVARPPRWEGQTQAILLSELFLSSRSVARGEQWHGDDPEEAGSREVQPRRTQKFGLHLLEAESADDPVDDDLGERLAAGSPRDRGTVEVVVGKEDAFVRVRAGYRKSRGVDELLHADAVRTDPAAEARRVPSVFERLFGHFERVLAFPPFLLPLHRERAVDDRVGAVSPSRAGEDVDEPVQLAGREVADREGENSFTQRPVAGDDRVHPRRRGGKREREQRVVLEVLGEDDLFAATIRVELLLELLVADGRGRDGVLPRLCSVRTRGFEFLDEVGLHLGARSGCGPPLHVVEVGALKIGVIAICRLKRKAASASLEVCVAAHRAKPVAELVQGVDFVLFDDELERLVALRERAGGEPERQRPVVLEVRLRDAAPRRVDLVDAVELRGLEYAFLQLRGRGNRPGGFMLGLVSRAFLRGGDHRVVLCFDDFDARVLGHLDRFDRRRAHFVDGFVSQL
mmetsp:Transcript_13947/g.50079  ORF Transcript_13947/g.50079 Transcript_13947/m.50079 type:complete len:503 (+) Transcript_13947:563-2071(+)